jgi:ABC-2 family transporter protein
LRSHNLHHVAAAPFAPLLIKEVREIVAGRALWIMLLIMCPLVGYSFFQALSLYGESSVAAQQSPALAVSLSPLDGVLVPTFGSLYVAVTLLFPFVAIRTLSHEKESGSLKLLVQLPYSSGNLVLTKMIAVMVAWLLASFPVVTALIIWGLLGGHLAPGETFALFLGHALYAALVGAIALFCASITDSAASAAIVTLAFTIGSWALDFTIAGRPGILEWFARLSLTQTIKSFEQGLLALGIVFGMAVAIGGFLVLAGIWMHPGVFAQQRLRRSLVCLGAVVIGLTVASQVKPAIDTSEDQRNSFPIADQRALKTLREQLSVIVHLAPEDRATWIFDAWPSSIARCHSLPCDSRRTDDRRILVRTHTAQSNIDMARAAMPAAQPVTARFYRLSTILPAFSRPHRYRGPTTPDIRLSPILTWSCPGSSAVFRF